jgi:hypothetical protein
MLAVVIQFIDMTEYSIFSYLSELWGATPMVAPQKYES